MGTRSDIIVHREDGKWARVYCHWDGYLEHNGRILFDHYTSQEKVEALVSKGNMSSLGRTIGRKHSFDGPSMYLGKSIERNPAYDKWQKSKEGVCTFYIRDRGMGGWHYAKTKEEFLASESAKVGDTLHEVWPEEDTWTEFTYVWDEGKWWVGDPDEGTQTLIDLGDALMGKKTLKPAVKAFGMVIGEHAAHDPKNPDEHKWGMYKNSPLNRRSA